MNKRFLFNWSIIIAVISGVYCSAYTLLPLPAQNLMWMNFVAIPIYFNAGAKLEEYTNYVSSMVAGIGWALLNLYVIKILGETGVNISVNILISTTIITVVCCAIHFCVTGNTWFNKIPIIFGTMACIFSQNGENILSIAITLFGGITVAMLLQQGTKLLDEQGQWRFFKKNKSQLDQQI